jgi:hypothetical protein
VGKEAENHSSKEKNRNVDLCKEKKIAFFLEWGKMSLDKDLLMGDPFIPFVNKKGSAEWPCLSV